jgi:hypothetical protein
MQAIDSLQQQLRDNMVPQEDNLEPYWFFECDPKDGIVKKTFTVVCGDCGNRYMLWVELGLRCSDCGAFHSHLTFLRVQREVQKASRSIHHAIQRLPQPYLNKYRNRQRIRVKAPRPPGVALT